jgi:MOSC domain-containing protein YiiM
VTEGERATAEVVAVCVGAGGIPNHEVGSARVDANGLEGDKHRYHEHGGPNRAVCLLSEEDVRSLENDGVEVGGPGAFGENLLVRGLDRAALRPGDRLAVGDEVVIELCEVREPCNTLKPLDRRFPDLMIGRSGWVCSVVRAGVLAPGQSVHRRAAEPSDE